MFNLLRGEAIPQDQAEVSLITYGAKEGQVHFPLFSSATLLFLPTL